MDGMSTACYVPKSRIEKGKALHSTYVPSNAPRDDVCSLIAPARNPPTDVGFDVISQQSATTTATATAAGTGRRPPARGADVID